MTRRVIALLWILFGAAVWNGFFDLYVSRGANRYLQARAEFELGRGPEPSMSSFMDAAKRDGMIAGTLWAAAVIAAGWGTLAYGRRRPDGGAPPRAR